MDRISENYKSYIKTAAILDPELQKKNRANPDYNDIVKIVKAFDVIKKEKRYLEDLIEDMRNKYGREFFDKPS